MAHPEASSRSLEFFLDLGNLSSAVTGGTVVTPPNDEEWWESQGVGTHYGIEFTVYNAFSAGVSEPNVSLSRGDIFWDDTSLGLENGPDPLVGFKIGYRGYKEVISFDGIWKGERTYPETTEMDSVFSNSQTRTPSLWPSAVETPEDVAWKDRVFPNQKVNWSTAIEPLFHDN